jgi:TolB-like protein/Tfp pilus assembly protein PilF
MPSPDDRLDSWKEIAGYLNRSVRTVKRWEREEGLPVHRHLHRSLASVFADKVEIDAWRQSPARASEPRQSAGSVKPAPEPKSIAILPFRNLSADSENEYFADGLTEEVTAALSKVRALRVTSRTSAMTFHGTTRNLKSIAAALGVRHVLEGSVRRTGNRVRITAQLIDAATDDHLWAETFEGTVDDIFEIQERLARLIVEALRLRLSPDEEQRLAQRGIGNVHAYDCYLRARHETWRWRRDAIDHAIRLLRNGLDIVGDNALLDAAMGLAYLQYREAGIDFSEKPLLEAESCERKASALDPQSSAVLRLRGWLHYSRGRIQEAVEVLKEALDVEPNNADTMLLLCNCYLIAGKVDSARPLLGPLLAIDPLTPLTRCLPAYADIMEGKFSDSAEPYRQMLEMDPSNPMARLFYIWVLVLNERAGEVDALIDTFPTEVRDTIAGRIAFFLSRASAGEGAAAADALTAEIESIAENSSEMFPRFLAQGFALAGMKEKAIDWLEIAVRRGFTNYPFLAQYDPFLKDVRREPRFVELMKTVRERWEKFADNR